MGMFMHWSDDDEVYAKTKTYKCYRCGKEFKQEENLLAQRFGLEDERMCAECDKLYWQHMREFHELFVNQGKNIKIVVEV